MLTIIAICPLAATRHCLETAGAITQCDCVEGQGRMPQAYWCSGCRWCRERLNRGSLCGNEDLNDAGVRVSGAADELGALWLGQAVHERDAVAQRNGVHGEPVLVD